MQLGVRKCVAKTVDDAASANTFARRSATNADGHSTNRHGKRAAATVLIAQLAINCAEQVDGAS
jgi:hypothetical protein